MNKNFVCPLSRKMCDVCVGAPTLCNRTCHKNLLYSGNYLLHTIKSLSQLQKAEDMVNWVNRNAKVTLVVKVKVRFRQLN